MKKLKRGPLQFLSFICFLIALLVTAYFLSGEKVASALWWGLSAIATLFAFFPKRVTVVEDFLDKAITPKAHVILISLCCMYIVGLIFYVIKNFKVDLTVTKKTS